ncbi:hypothetical protein J6590_059594 [Homalodisca vitripennis]|nr:hypothetical protein J6590_059594 [Homalodisca vitripennis]
MEVTAGGADLTAPNSDKRTPLHIACSLGNIKVVKYLLLNGASVHMKDRCGSKSPFEEGNKDLNKPSFTFDQTPLLDAVKCDHLDVIKLLKRCGAHLTLTPNQIGCQLCRAASYGNMKRLLSLQAAGANLSQPDISGRTSLHLAAMHNHEEIVKFLLANGVSTKTKDMMGFTPLDVAEKMGHTEIIKLLKSAKN